VYGEKFWEVVRVATPDLKAVANRVEGDLTAYETCLAAADDKGAGDLESRIRHDVERIIGNCLPAGYFADYRRGAEPRRLRETVQLWGYHQPLAVARAARLFAEPAWLAACVRTVETLIDPLLDKVFPIVPHAWPVDGLGHPLAWPDESVRWSGTAYHVSSLVAGLTELYLATGDRSYGERAIRIADWLLGENPAGESMYHPILGGCYDGMTDGAINRNLGAESSIEAGRAELFRYRCEHALAESDGEADAAPSDRRRANQGLTAGEAHAAG
jgi:hypothetical protein